MGTRYSPIFLDAAQAYPNLNVIYHSTTDFHDLFTVSLAEALLKNPNGGAIGVWASSALTLTPSQLSVAMALNRQLLLDGNAAITLGDAILQAKQATRDLEVRRTWILFGDPTLRLRQ